MRLPLHEGGLRQGAHIELRDRQDATSRFILGAILTQNESVIGAVRRELRRVVDVLVDDADIVRVLREEVIKRDTLEGPEAESAARRVNRTEAKALRKVGVTISPEVKAQAAEREVEEQAS